MEDDIEFPISSTLNHETHLDVEAQIQSTELIKADEVDRELVTESIEIDANYDAESVLSFQADDDEIGLPTDLKNIESAKQCSLFRKGRILIRSSSQVDTYSAESLNSPTSCSICLQNYSVGDDICWSRNDECKHAFHIECISHWLMKHNDCPICRSNYLTKDN